MRNLQRKKLEGLFYNYPRNKKALQFKQQKIESLTSSVQSGWTIDVSRKKTHTQPDSFMVNRVSLIKKVEGEFKDLQEQVDLVETLLSLLNEDYKEFVKLKYFENKRWDVVADELCIGVRTAFRWRDRIFEICGPFLKL